MFRNKEFIIEILIQIVKSALAITLAFIIVNIFKAKIINISETLNSQKQAAFALERRGQTIRQLQEDFKIIGNGERMLSLASPDADNVVEFKSALEGVANRQSLQSVVEFSLPAPDQKSIDYSVSLSAGTNSLITYLKYFESLPYLTGINSIEIRSGDNSTWESSPVVNIRGKVFTKPITN
jgi:hypothetical protein